MGISLHFGHRYSLGTSARKRLKVARPSRALTSLYKTAYDIISYVLCNKITKIMRDPRHDQGVP